MEIAGSLEENLRGALASVSRHKGHPVRRETVQHWADLLSLARAKLADGHAASPDLVALIANLDAEVADRLT